MFSNSRHDTDIAARLCVLHTGQLETVYKDLMVRNM